MKAEESGRRRQGGIGVELADRHGVIPIYGHWYCDTNAPVVSLNYGKSEGAYWIPLADLETRNDVLRWIMHLARKTRAYTSEDVGDLVRSLEFLLRLEDTDQSLDAEVRAVMAIHRRPLPCEQGEILRRSTNNGSVSLGAYWEAERAVIEERHATGRHALSPYAEKLLANWEQRS